MNPTPARKAITKSTATSRSAFCACLVFSGSAENAGWLGSAGTSTAFGAGEGVPMTRRGPAGSSGVSLMVLLRFTLDVVPPLGGEPHGDEHEEAEAAKPAEEALGDRAGAAKRQAAWVGLFPRVDDVGDDVLLLGGRDRPVAEDRHGLRAGQHRFVNLAGRRRVERRRRLAVGQRAAGAGEPVALRAVRAEQLRAERRVGAARGDLRRARDRRAAAERGDVGGDVVDLLLRELRLWLAVVLCAQLLGGHAARRHLEVHRGGAGAGAWSPWHEEQLSMNSE